jgi:glycine/D-amino acid oxidase-like deaminating enzyme/acyl carrier protein
VVIGGGAAGLSAAHELEKRGHRVTVLEREQTLGGKSASFDIDGHSFDLGTHICTGQYHRVKQLAAEIGCATELLTPLLSFDLVKRALFAPGVSFMSEMAAYTRLMELYTNKFPGIHRPGLHHAAQELAQPIDEWLREHGMVELLRATGIDIGYASSGYGYLDSPELAMLYLMKMIDLSGFVDPTPQEDYQGEWTISGCFMNLWRRLALALGDVRCGVAVRRIERRPDKVVITTDSATLECDDVVLALPLEKSLGILDASDEERDLFRRIRHNLYFTTVAAAKGLPRDGFYMVAQNSLDSSRVGRCTAFHHRYADSDVYTFYAYGGPGIDGAAVVEQLASDVRQMGGELGTVHYQQPWDYFPHVTPADIRDRFYERMEALQGQSRTYYVGSLLGYELVECTVAYSQELIARSFQEVRSPELAEKQARLASLSPSSGRAAPEPRVRVVRQAAEIRDWLVEHLARELRLPKERISPTAALESFGLDSVVASSLVGQFSDWLGFRITPAIIVEYPTVDAVAKHLSQA